MDVPGALHARPPGDISGMVLDTKLSGRSRQSGAAIGAQRRVRGQHPGQGLSRMGLVRALQDDVRRGA